METRRKIPHSIAVLALFAGLCSAGHAQTSPGQSATLKDIVTSELAAHPKAQVVDIYKLIYQGAFGIGHMIKSRQAAADYLRSELGSLQPSSMDEPLLQTCDPGGTQYRINLRPFIAAGYSDSILIDAMMYSVQNPAGDAHTFEARWLQTGKMLRAIAPEVYNNGFHEFTEEMSVKGYPARHHSAVYRNAYAPAYRVLTRTAIERFFPSMLENGK